MEQHESSRSDQSDMTRDADLSHEVAARSAKRRQTTSFTELFSFIVAIISAVFGVIPLIIQLVSPKSSNTFVAIAAIVGFIAVLIAAITIWILRRLHPVRDVYTSEQDIRDDNLRELISEIARGQDEFERHMALSNRPSLPES
jgi:uncharacterized membrane protein